MKLCKVLSISNCEKVQCILADIIFITDKFIIFVEIPIKVFKNKIVDGYCKNMSDQYIKGASNTVPDY